MGNSCGQSRGLAAPSLGQGSEKIVMGTAEEAGNGVGATLRRNNMQGVNMYWAGTGVQGRLPWSELGRSGYERPG